MSYTTNLPGYGDSATWGGRSYEVQSKPDYMFDLEVDRFEDNCAVPDTAEYERLTETLADNNDFWLAIAQNNMLEATIIRKQTVVRIIAGGYYD